MMGVEKLTKINRQIVSARQRVDRAQEELRRAQEELRRLGDEKEMAIRKECEEAESEKSKAVARFKEAERMKKEAEAATWQQEPVVVGEAAADAVSDAGGPRGLEMQRFGTATRTWHATGTGPPATRYLQEKHISEGGTQTQVERQLGLPGAPRLITDYLTTNNTPANSGEAAADGEGAAADDTPANSGDTGGGDAAQGSGAEGDTKRKRDDGGEDEERKKKKRKKHKKKKRKKHKKKRKPQGKMPMAEIDKKVAAALEVAKCKNIHEDKYACQSQRCKPGGVQHHAYERDCLYELHQERFHRRPGGRSAKCVAYLRKLLDEDDPTRINGDRRKRGTVSSESSSSESESESESS
jgi:hypothetical protein